MSEDRTRLLRTIRSAEENRGELIEVISDIFDDFDREWRPRQRHRFSADWEIYYNALSNLRKAAERLT